MSLFQFVGSYVRHGDWMLILALRRDFVATCDQIKYAWRPRPCHARPERTRVKHSVKAQTEGTFFSAWRI